MYKHSKKNYNDLKVNDINIVFNYNPLLFYRNIWSSEVVMPSKQKIRVSVIGASGYTGAELIRILLTHPNVEIKHLIAERSAGQTIEAIYSHFRNYDLPAVIRLDEASFNDVDVAFCCLPHATTQEVVKTLPEGLKIIDLSADFRLYDAETYAKWYGHEHLAPELQKDAAYGLTEFYRDKIKQARIVACPGCYPTSAVLPLVPLVKGKLIGLEHIIIDSKTGMTGAGRSAKQANLFTEVNENVKAYAVCQHRHMPEIEQTLTEFAGSDVQVHFTPQVVPMSRGILSSIYVHLNEGVTVDTLRQSLTDFYQQEPFIHILPEGELPTTRDVRDTNHCHISVVPGRSGKTAVIVSVIDNLTKGSSGQAVQNMNLMFGLDEMTGLTYVPAFP